MHDFHGGSRSFVREFINLLTDEVNLLPRSSYQTSHLVCTYNCSYIATYVRSYINTRIYVGDFCATRWLIFADPVTYT